MSMKDDGRERGGSRRVVGVETQGRAMDETPALDGRRRDVQPASDLRVARTGKVSQEADHEDVHCPLRATADA